MLNKEFLEHHKFKIYRDIDDKWVVRYKEKGKLFSFWKRIHSFYDDELVSFNFDKRDEAETFLKDISKVHENIEVYMEYHKTLLKECVTKKKAKKRADREKNKKLIIK